MRMTRAQGWLARWATVGICAASGLIWGLVALFIGQRPFGPRIWGGMVVAPLIGIAVGRGSSALSGKSRLAQIVWALGSLYVGAAAFAIGIGVLSPVSNPPNPTFSAAVIEPVLVVLWGLTFGGWALVLWPLAFLNHKLVWSTSHANESSHGDLRG
jgi:hypothetical protein